LTKDEKETRRKRVELGTPDEELHLSLRKSMQNHRFFNRHSISFCDLYRSAPTFRGLGGIEMAKQPFCKVERSPGLGIGFR
jgi:hypothetical protein